MNPSESGRVHGTWMPGILSDHQIIHLCEHHKMIEPFEREPVRDEPGGFAVGGARTARRVVSYGPSHYGYDIRVADEFRVFKATSCAPVECSRPRRARRSTRRAWTT
jgi:deoxycytidine triphosphate deaminase